MPYFEASDGTSLFYTSWGSGSPVVLIHGWTMGAAMWEYQFDYLTSHGQRCITYDQRGCGKSDQPGHGYDFDTLAGDLASLLEKLDLRDVTLVGYSLGGGVIARYLTSYGSARIARITLVSPTLPYLLKSDANPEGVDRSVIYDRFLAGLEADRPGLLSATAPAFFGVGLPGVSLSPEMIQWAVGLCHQASPKGMIELYRANNETDFRPDLAAFTVPTLIIHGDSDPLAPFEASSRRTSQAIEGSRLEWYAGASHGLFLTHRDRLNADLLSFITGGQG